MDISNIVATSYEFELKHPVSGAGLGIFLSLKSTDHEDVKRLEHSIQNRALQLRARGKTFTSDIIQKNTSDFFVSVISGWRWEKGADGEPALWKGKKPEFTPENVREVTALSWVQEQIDTEIGEKANFFKS